MNKFIISLVPTAFISGLYWLLLRDFEHLPYIAIFLYFYHVLLFHINEKVISIYEKIHEFQLQELRELLEIKHLLKKDEASTN